ncbi:transposase [Actinoplanes sp. SE50]|uniref:IS5 family transposase n=1 Tax=unclassified Actinoplanes TaxID=2626549 RepID=UPI00023EBDE3|nr:MULTISPECIES: IS5 family transposase [unclassified Actinoplanes]AEV86897.1 putative transposase [Actinoplanes sp. SE50/110]ATO85294.1 transposase [Actinoplanes sp. SE50]SLM02704.1 transposase [Actinoplanes sp. SE50/110]
MATLAVTRRHDLTDRQWAVLAPLLPAASTTGRPPKWDKRQLIDGIRWRIRMGTPWRDVPAVYPPWQTVYGLFRRWQRDGTWDRILAALQAAADTNGRIIWTVSVDSMTSRAHQHAAGARTNGHLQKEPPGGVHDEPADHALGRSHGGLTTKTHLACEQGQKVLSMVVTAGHRGDSPQFIPVLRRIRVTRLGVGRPRTCPDLVLADKAYTSRANRAYLRKRGIKACIPSKKDQDAHRKAKGSRGGRPPKFDKALYRMRHAVENSIARLKRYRGIATRYEKLAVRFQAALTIVIIGEWL